MRIVISGATGFLGRPLVRSLRADGHTVVGLSRSATASGDLVTWRPDGTAGDWSRHLDGVDAVVNLSGESIGGGRWTPARKARIRDSRLLATRSIAAAIAACARPPAFLLNASGVNYYGSRQDEILTEDSGPGSDFLATVCRDWEAEAIRAERSGCRVAVLRSGIVLHRDGGVLEQMARPFKWFAGGQLGSGRQYVSWIHRDDWLALVRFLVSSTGVRGAFNAAAPAPITNAEFTQALAHALHRPGFMRAPAFALKLALGEMAEALLLASLRAVPARALAAGFAFKYPTITEALGEIFGREEQAEKSNP